MEPLYENLIWASFIVGSIIIGGKVIFNSDYMKKKANARLREVTAKNPKRKGFIETAKAILDDPDSHLAQIDKEMDALRQQGVTEEQMGHLAMERKAVELAKGTFGQMFGEPIINIIASKAKDFGIKL